MTAEMVRSARRCNWSKVRWLIYLVIALGVVVWKYVPRPWTPARTLETPHYIIASTASPAQTEEVGRVVELRYNRAVGWMRLKRPSARSKPSKRSGTGTSCSSKPPWTER